jgi:two-component system cell cycle sensor histidine kinase/response regulator CckA
MKPIQVLVIEDERIVAKDIQSRLKKLGFEVPVVCTSGQEALQKVLESPPHVVLMDIHLKGEQDGVEIAKQLYHNFHIPIIYLTAYGDSETVSRAKIAEPFGYLLKPFQDEEIRLAIEIALYKHHSEQCHKGRERWLQSILNCIGDAVITTNESQCITFMNPVAEQLTGWTASSALLKPLEEVVRFEIPLVLPTSESFSAFAQKLHSVQEATRFLHTKSEQKIPIDLRIAPILKEKEEFAGIVLSFRNILLQKQAEEALQKSEEKLRSVLKNAPDFIISISPRAEILFINQIQPGFKIEEVLGKPIYNYIDPEHHPLVQESLSKVFQHGQSAHYEIKGYNPDGSERWYSSNIGPIKRGEVVVEATIISREITERKRMEDALRESERKSKNLLDSIPDLVFCLDKEGIFQGFKEVSENNELYVPPEQIVGQKISDLLPPSLMKHYDYYLNKAIETKKIQIFEYQLPIEGKGIQHYEARLILTGEEEIVVIVRNISEKKRIEERIQHTQKLESLSILAGGVAHDFNNLLMGILGNASLALTEIAKGSTLEESLKQIETAALRASDLIQQMLAYAGKGQLSVERIHLSELVQEMMQLLKAVLPKKVVLSSHFVWELPLIQADATQVRQVIMNLITNASEAIGEESNGRIELKTGIMKASREYLEGAFSDDIHEGFYVYIEVSDSGCGMDEKTLTKIFDPFFTTKFTGRGLGLASVLGIIRQHQGALKVQSTLGKGSTFRILFPSLEKPASLPEEPPSQNGMKSWKGQGTILLIEDEEIVRNTVQKMLQKFGFRTLSTGDGQEALELLRRSSSEICAILLDVTIPKMHLREIFAQFKKISPTLPILLTSGHPQQDVERELEEEGDFEFLQKPYLPKLLQKKLQELLKFQDGADAEGLGA